MIERSPVSIHVDHLLDQEDKQKEHDNRETVEGEQELPKSMKLVSEAELVVIEIPNIISWLIKKEKSGTPENMSSAPLYGDTNRPLKKKVAVDHWQLQFLTIFASFL